jgi:hypothetical protein
MSLKSRISRLEEKTGDNPPYKRVVSVVSHEHYPPEKLEAFLRQNGVDLDNPETFIINRVIIEPDGKGEKDTSGRGIFEPRIVNYA